MCRGGSGRSSVTENLLDATSTTSSHEGDNGLVAYNVQKNTLKQYVRIKRIGSNDASSSSGGSHHSRSLSPASSDQRDDEFDGNRAGNQMAAIGEQDSDEESGVYYIEQQEKLQLCDADSGQSNNRPPSACNNRLLTSAAIAAATAAMGNGDYRRPAYLAPTVMNQRRSVTPVILQPTVNHPGRIPLPSEWSDSSSSSGYGGVAFAHRPFDVTSNNQQQQQMLSNEFKGDAMAYRPASVAGNRINRCTESPCPTAMAGNNKQGILSRSKTYQPRSNHVPRYI